MNNIKTKEDREKQVKQALANGALEGMHPNPHFRALLDRYIAGEISLDDAIEITKAHYQQSSDSARKMPE